MKIVFLAFGLSVASAAALATPPQEDVGDPYSFGREVNHLGFAQTPTIALQEDCTPDPNDPPPPEDRCITLSAQPAPTTFNETNLATIRLPAAATTSLLCFALSPSATYEFFNLTSNPQSAARFVARSVITIENEVLNDPSLIDPNTGQPYGGRMTVSLTTFSESRSINPGEREQKTQFFTRHCIGGLVSKVGLLASGFSETQAALFFAKPMTLTFGASGTAQIVDFASYFYGIRLYGD